MSTINTVLNALQTAVNTANTTTGGSDTNVTDAINSLIAGYGTGGSDDGGINAYSGEITPTERQASFTFECKNVTNFAIATFDDPDLTTGCALFVSLVANKNGTVRAVASTNTGANITVGANYSKAPTNYPSITFGSTEITLSFDNYKISYCHVSPNFIVNVGDFVEQGQVIGYVGPKYVYGVPGNQYTDTLGKPTNGATTRLSFAFTVSELMINM